MWHTWMLWDLEPPNRWVQKREEHALSVIHLWFHVGFRWFNIWSSHPKDMWWYVKHCEAVPMPSHAIHVWYVCLHEWLIFIVNDGKSREIYHTWMLWVVITHFQNFLLLVLRSVTNVYQKVYWSTLWWRNMASESPHFEYDIHLHKVHFLLPW